ncbi:MAG: hypothetical protein H7098_11515, partial [Oligoflexus sp.]|nr:hypothetical protein [Pseudopedobacter sp.]
PIGFTFSGLNKTNENQLENNFSSEQESNPFLDHVCKAFKDYLKEEINREFGGLESRIDRFQNRIKAATLLYEKERKELFESSPQFSF